jgi:hypothetical protein
MKTLLFLIACLLIPAVLVFAHQVWLLRLELRAPVQAGGPAVESRYGMFYGFLGGAWSMFFGGILWSVYQSGPATFGEWGLFVGVPTALSVLLLWLYLITKVTADELGVRGRGVLGRWLSADWTQIVKVDHTSQPRGWFRLHTADGRVIRVYPGLTHLSALSAMILSRTPADVIAPGTRDLLSRCAQGEEIGVEQFNERIHAQPRAMLRLAGGLVLAGLVCGIAAWCGYAYDARLLVWLSQETLSTLRQMAMSFALVFILWSLAFAAVATVTAIKRASQRRRDSAAGHTPQMQ